MEIFEFVFVCRNSKIFSVLDTNNGFWNVKLDEFSSKLCTFNTPLKGTDLGGLKCSSEVFQRKVMQCFEDIEGVEISVLICGENKKHHNERLQKVLDRARKCNIQFNKGKCQFC